LNYHHIFFDLDLTLWDFNKNSKEVLTELFSELKITEKHSLDFDEFHRVYLQVNEQLWNEYRKNNVSKEELRNKRFKETFKSFNVSDSEIEQAMSEEYIKRSPFKKHLFPYAKEVLEYLSGKYQLHIITNGFEEVQHIKLESCEIKHYFKNIITSESAGHKKPHPGIFHYSLYRAKSKPGKSIMVGDHLEIDILGAKNAGLDQVFFNPENIPHKEKVTYEINCLSKLKAIF
jgi:putative hydrolase of the HAD superfamily